MTIHVNVSADGIWVSGSSVYCMEGKLRCPLYDISTIAGWGSCRFGPQLRYPGKQNLSLLIGT
jgi:hypothetical protein